MPTMKATVSFQSSFNVDFRNYLHHFVFLIIFFYCYKSNSSATTVPKCNLVFIKMQKNYNKLFMVLLTCRCSIVWQLSLFYSIQTVGQVVHGLVARAASCLGSRAHPPPSALQPHQHLAAPQTRRGPLHLLLLLPEIFFSCIIHISGSSITFRSLQ